MTFTSSRTRRFKILLALAVAQAGCDARPPDEPRLVQDAVDYAYSGAYVDLDDLRKDYPGFTPRIRKWSDDLLFLFGDGLYAVRMPDAEVIVTRDGVARTSRTCGSVEAECVAVAPVHLELGVVGTVQFDGPDYPVATNFQVAWQGSPGEVRVIGHCFVAFKASAEPLVLTISAPGHGSLELQPAHGRRLVAATLGHVDTHYASMPLSRIAFEASRDCSEQARAAWPNVGGWSWRR